MVLEQKALYNTILAETTPFSKNATCLSPLSQNESIEIMGINIIQSEVIEKK